MSTYAEKIAMNEQPTTLTLELLRLAAALDDDDNPVAFDGNLARNAALEIETLRRLLSEEQRKVIALEATVDSRDTIMGEFRRRIERLTTQLTDRAKEADDSIHYAGQCCDALREAIQCIPVTTLVGPAAKAHDRWMDVLEKGAALSIQSTFNGGLPTSGRGAVGNAEAAQTDAARNPRAEPPSDGTGASDGGCVITTRDPAATSASQELRYREVESSAPTTSPLGVVNDSRDSLRLKWLAETIELSEDQWGACNWNGTLLKMVLDRFRNWRRLPPNDAFDAMRKAIDTQVVHEDSGNSQVNSERAVLVCRDRDARCPTPDECATGCTYKGAPV